MYDNNNNKSPNLQKNDHNLSPPPVSNNDEPSTTKKKLTPLVEAPSENEQDFKESNRSNKSNTKPPSPPMNENLGNNGTPPPGPPPPPIPGQNIPNNTPKPPPEKEKSPQVSGPRQSQNINSSQSYIREDISTPTVSERPTRTDYSTPPQDNLSQKKSSQRPSVVNSGLPPKSKETGKINKENKRQSIDKRGSIASYLKSEDGGVANSNKTGGQDSYLGGNLSNKLGDSYLGGGGSSKKDGNSIKNNSFLNSIKIYIKFRQQRIHRR